MAITDVTVVSVPVSDPERSKAFYVDVLGLALMRDDSSVPGMRWVQLAPGGGGTQITLATWFDSMPSGSLRGLVLLSDDLQGDYEKLEAQGVRFDAPPRDEPWGRETMLFDPDGNGIVLQQASETAPAVGDR